ncbi:MAG: 2-aminoethylphosphonate--pyruvate transaminase [Alphaproteobacteria bacterium]|jgi:2-aminoethylphosphonate-pyruvate transaminase|nr:2-aminoethylphosphonate--pyruvate transaminase [Alphaproteobacteria bacterium]
MKPEGGEPYLLTPGPLTTSATTKRAMLRDWGSRDQAFIALNARIRERLLEIAGVPESHVAVPVQGSGTFAVEATLGTLIRPGAKTLVLVNGAYGKRIVTMLERMGRATTTLEWPEDRPADPAALDAALEADPAIAHVVVVHCETTSGVLNPIPEVAEVASRHGRPLIIDSMSAFGALPFDGGEVVFEALVASANKCFEGVPGFGYAIIEKAALEAAAGNAHSLSLDLYEQWRGLEGNGQWRFTPPTHVLAAFDQALAEHAEEGGVAGRHARYSENCRILIDGMRRLGFETLLADAVQAPIIVTFLMPTAPAFDFQRFYDGLAERGFVIYPGKLTVADSFRIGCIGRLGAEEMHQALAAVTATLSEMGIENLKAPAQASAV